MKKFRQISASALANAYWVNCKLLIAEEINKEIADLSSEKKLEFKISIEKACKSIMQAFSIVSENKNEYGLTPQEIHLTQSEPLKATRG